MIYAIRAIGTEYVKFGYTGEAEAKSRLRDLQVGSPHELQLIASGPGELALERKIHRRLKKAGEHVRGEWFTYGKEAYKIVWEIRDSAEVMANSPEAVDLPTLPKAPGRLGRVLAYAKRFTDDTPAEEPSVPRLA